MGRGRQSNRRSGRPPNYILTEIARRSLQSDIARAIKRQRPLIRRLRGNPITTNKKIITGKISVETIERYLDSSGIAGTVGDAKNLGQGVGGAIYQVQESRTRMLYSKMLNLSINEITNNDSRFLYSGCAFLTNITIEVYENVLSASLLTQSFLSIVYRWKKELLKGKYTIYVLQDLSSPMITGEYPPFGISTERDRLEKYLYDIKIAKGSISKWMEIRGRQPFPKQRSNYKPLSYSTFKQG